MMRRGFTLIEVLIAMAISSMMGIILFGILSQSERAVVRIDERVDFSMRAEIFAHQFRKDISGVTIPTAAQIDLTPIEEEKPQEESKEKGAQQKNPAEEKKKAEEAEKKRQEEEKRIKKLFVARNKGDQLEELTFITNNPLSIYWGPKSGHAKPHLCRVTYKFKRISEAPIRYEITRQESAVEGSPVGAAQKPLPEYVVINGIKSLSVTYYAAEKIKKAEGKPGQIAAAKNEGAESKPIKYQEFKDWDTENRDKRFTELERVVPDYLDVTLTLWDNKEQREMTYVIRATVAADLSPKQGPSTLLTRENLGRLLNFGGKK